jgi:HSP20 family protein
MDGACRSGWVKGGPGWAEEKEKPRPNMWNMDSLTRWDPFRELEDMQQRLSSVLGRRPQREGKESISVAEWAPLVDIAEDEKEYLIKAELPDIKRDQIKVTVENGVLAISGERKFEKEEKGKKYHRIERAYGSFVRSFGLPDDADAEKVNADFKDGILTVHVAKSEAARPKQIEVKVT